MRRRTFLRATLLCALSLLLPGRTALAQEPTRWILLGRGSHGTAQTTRFNAIGIQITGEDSDRGSIIPELNTFTQALGRVFEGAHEGCGEPFHYHGELFGLTDDGLSCGWGAAFPYEEAPASVQRYSDAMVLEWQARRAMEAATPDFAAARDFLGQAITALQRAQQEVAALQSQGTLSRRTSRWILARISKALRRQTRSAQSLDRYLSTGRSSDATRAKRYLSQSTKLNQLAMKRLVDSLNFM